jgi:hypothetical protein
VELAANTPVEDFKATAVLDKVASMGSWREI